MINYKGGVGKTTITANLGAAVKAAWDVLSGRDPVHLGRHETGVDDALRT